MDIFWLLIQSAWKTVVAAVITGLVSGLCSALLIAQINTTLFDSTPTTTVSLFAGLVLLVFITGVVSQFLIINLSQNSVYDLRMRLSQRILSAPLTQLEQLGPSRLLAALTKDVQAISDSIFVLPFLCIDAAIILGCLSYLGNLSGWGLVFVVVALCIGIVGIQLLIKAAYSAIADSRKAIDLLFNNFRGITDGTKELKLNRERRSQFFTEDLQVSARAARDYNKKAFQFAALATGSGQIVFFALIGLVLFVLPANLPDFQDTLPAYVITLTYLTNYLEGLLRRLPNLLSTNVSIRNIKQMGLTLSQQTERSQILALPNAQTWQTLTLRDVTYHYSNHDTTDGERSGQFSVGPINLSFQAGELVFLIGGNGSGKSTLAKLLCGLYSPDGGEVYLDNTLITQDNQAGYRELFSTVFSDFYLFPRLVAADTRNLETLTEKYLQRLELDQKVTITDGKLSTTALSQGQRKRLALLNAYLEDRPICLFDEWAADQDPYFRELFYTQLIPNLKQQGKTLIIISHDDHYFHLADRLIKLDYGQIESDIRPIE